MIEGMGRIFWMSGQWDGGDVVDDSTVHGPEERAEADLGTLQMDTVLPDEWVDRQQCC